VRRLDGNPGYGPAANEVLEVVDGAAYYLFCHDDVRLAPDAVRLLVEEALRSNAGVTGPKVTAWGDPRSLLQVGMSIDKTGAPAASVERGELDQEQHDRVRDVFWLPGACLLVRADLFEALGGFDRAITFLGEDLDLCWRAQVVGARVVVVPGARVEHLEALSERRPVDDRRRLQTRHRLRTMLISYGWFHLLRVVPQAAVVALIEVVYAIVIGRGAQARDIAGAWAWNFGRFGDIRSARRRLRPLRAIPDADLRRLQVRGSARFSAFVRGELGGEDRMRAFAIASRDVAESLRRGPLRSALAVWVVVLVVLAIGSRELLTDRLPAIGGLATFPDGPGDFLRAYVSGFRDNGLGSEAPAPTAFGLLGAGGVLLLGAMGQLQKILVLGMLPVGLLGAWRLTAALGSPRARLTALIVYAAVPLPYDSLARGRWGGLLLYAGAPWVLARLLRATRLPPFGEVEDGLRSHPGRRREMLALGLLVALLSAFVPAVLLIVPGVAAALFAGSLLVGGTQHAGRALGVVLGAAAAAAVLHFPWTLDFVLPGAEWSAVGGVEPVDVRDLAVGHLLRFETGPLGAPPLGWAFLGAAALPLLIGQDWRFAWAVRAWAVAIVAWITAWAGAEGWVRLPPADLHLAFAATALAFSVALGMVAFERDLPAYRFGWRQMASVLAAAAVLAGTLPVLGATIDGRWHAPDTDFGRTLGFLGEQVSDEGSFRVLWLGHPEVLPLSGWRLERDLTYATSDDGPPDARDLWASAGSGPTPLLADAVRLAAGGRTNRLGRLLAPMGVRYLALVDSAAPARTHGPRLPLPAGLLRTMDDQLDLRRVEADPAITLYENTAFAPARAAVTADQAAALEEVSALAFFDTIVGLQAGDWQPAVTETSGHARYRGDVPTEALYLASASSGNWRLRVDGETASREKALGWANVFRLPAGGDEAVLRYRTPVAHYGVIGIQVLLWLFALRALLTRNGRRRRAVG